MLVECQSSCIIEQAISVAMSLGANRELDSSIERTAEMVSHFTPNREF